MLWCEGWVSSVIINVIAEMIIDVITCCYFLYFFNISTM